MTQLLEFLISNQNSDGGWGFHPAGPSAVEATSWAMMSLHSLPSGKTLSPSGQSEGAPGSDSQREAREARARDWLLRAQLADGSWPPFPGHPQGCWVTSVACQALHAHGGAIDAVERGRQWILKAWPAEGSLWWRLRQTLSPARFVHQDCALRGWNWTPGTASWIEPTAHALLFLRSLPAEMLSSQAHHRQQLAERMLYDRMCPGGGWNSGNPLVYGVAGVPRCGPTAWALLALRDHAERAEVQMSLGWLEGAYGAIRGAASLALAHRCLTTYGRRVPPLAPALAELYERNRFFENVLTVAWAALALREEAARS